MDGQYLIVHRGRQTLNQALFSRWLARQEAARRYPSQWLSLYVEATNPFCRDIFWRGRGDQLSAACGCVFVLAEWALVFADSNEHGQAYSVADALAVMRALGPVRPNGASLLTGAVAGLATIILWRLFS